MSDRDKIVEAFSAGYQAGHEHTVEGNFCSEGVVLGEEYYEEIKAPKRKPDTTGVLPLTDEELEEFSKKFLNQFLSHKAVSIKVEGTGILLSVKTLYEIKTGITLRNYKAIIWLAERFNLTGGE